MNTNNLFFHIHYCNGSKHIKPRGMPNKVARTIQHHELAFVTGGKGSITIENKEYQVKEGMLFHICPDVLHWIESDPDEPASLLTVHFSYTRVNFNDGKWDIENNTKKIPLHTGQELKDYYAVEELFKKLVDCWNAKLPGYEFISKTFLQQLLIAISQNISKQDKNFAVSLKVEKIIQYMHQNINGRVTLTQLSEMVHLSTFYLSRVFKETTGYSIIEFFNKLKIDKAKELLIEGNKKVKEVAQELGFIDEFYFSRKFKKIEGISPSEFYSKNVHEV